MTRDLRMECYQFAAIVQAHGAGVARMVLADAFDTLTHYNPGVRESDYQTILRHIRQAESARIARNRYAARAA
jgi:hypothetical protein